ncbi:MAG: PEP/pyruvate-binding domain-containing protein [Gammaproteobacteria bacterium]|nr:PEP/pyruvate-binding domain-containing protein [Gammaproteobacteria bacterium]MBU1730906.1 PEP/pyruvate-binding domain-containing protein [Gammaproteobacteria bacterium]MBU1893566.1 PEP/pyruvate-binding domain-containing protein [Gammaproteobacteria bacterium]
MNHEKQAATLPFATLVAARGLMIALFLILAPLATPSVLADTGEMARWIAGMKTDPRGPFDGIYWFCKDGAVLPPEPYACTSHGGGIQHGRLGERARTLREAGFLVGNVLAASDHKILASTQGRPALNAILLERYLVAADNGWILRRARYYRGAFQIEDETAAAEAILTALAASQRGERGFLLLRQAALLLPRARNGGTVTRSHELSSTLATLDTGFAPLRNKLHSQPEAADAERVRAYARQQRRSEPEFEQLAQAIEALFVFRELGLPLRELAKRLDTHPLAGQLRDFARELEKPLSPAQRFAASAALLAELREALPKLPPRLRLAALRLSLDVEAEAFTTGLGLLDKPPRASRAERLALLGSATEAMYGTGLLTLRERQATQQALGRLSVPSLPLEQYRAELGYLARVPAWAGRELGFHFAEAVTKLARIEPLASQFVPDRLRASPLLVYSTLLDGLLQEANSLAGIEHEVFGQPVGVGLRALNPGLARGVLRLDISDPRPDGIYLLPETTANLPPVAGILTSEAGNILSHVQLLASNFGIPNVVVDAGLVSRLQAMAGRIVVMAVSPGGRVLISEDGPRWESVFIQEGRTPERIHPDFDKLDLARRDPIPLGELRAVDAGRIAGPKAARLGELKSHYPEEVSDGLVIPFGAYRAFLEQPMPGTGMSTFAWMRAEYRRIGSLSAQQQEAEARKLRERLRAWIVTAEPGASFRTALGKAMRERFGPDGSYAVFVRSDTNVEDLPGFSGAGLNLTVPNVTGLDRVVEAILQVWASPFDERAFAWRQMRMDLPEHVYVSVLLQRSVAVDKSGVMVTLDLEGGSPEAYTVAANEGVGGAVSGQAAEELLITAGTGEVRLLAEASATTRRILVAGGGLEGRPVSGQPVLAPAEIEQLRQLGRELPDRFPQRDETGQIVPADVEFGFVAGRLALFQIRPYLQSREALRNRFLLELDAPLRTRSGRVIKLREEM